MAKTTKEIIEEARAKGFSVEFTTDKDAHIRIKEINGVRYSRSKGNIALRNLLGEGMSQSALTQRREAAASFGSYQRRYKAKTGKVYRTKDLPPLTKEERKQIAEINKAYRLNFEEEQRAAAGKKPKGVGAASKPKAPGTAPASGGHRGRGQRQGPKKPPHVSLGTAREAKGKSPEEFFGKLSYHTKRAYGFIDGYNQAFLQGMIENLRGMEDSPLTLGQDEALGVIWEKLKSGEYTVKGREFADIKDLLYTMADELNQDSPDGEAIDRLIEKLQDSLFPTSGEAYDSWVKWHRTHRNRRGGRPKKA